MNYYIVLREGEYVALLMDKESVQKFLASKGEEADLYKIIEDFPCYWGEFGPEL